MRQRSVVLTFGLLTACLAAGYGVLFTMLDDYRDTYGIGEGSLGAIIGIGFFSGFLAQIFIAPLADRGFARRLMLGGMFLNVAGLVLMAVATTFGPLLFGRFVMGAGIGMAVPAIRRIVILSDPSNLGHNLGRLLAIDVAGFAAGPLVSAALVGPFGIAAPFLVIAAGTVAVLPSVWNVKVDETVVTASAQRFAVDLLAIRPFAGAVALGSAVFFMIGAFDALWAVALTDLDAADWVVNVGITVFALPLVIFGAIGGRLAQRVGPFPVATVGLSIGAACMALYGHMPTAMGMFAVAVVHSVNDGLTVSSAGVAVGLVVPPERQAGAQGVLGGLQTLTAGFAAVVTGVVYEAYGRTVAYTVAALLMTVLIVVGAVLSWPSWSVRGKGDAEPVDDRGGVGGVGPVTAPTGG